MSTIKEITIEKIEETDVFKNFVSHCPMFTNGFVRFQPGGCVMPPCYEKFNDRMQGFKLRDDDVWVSSFPKSGTTWTQEMVWNIMNNVDLETAKAQNLDERVPFLEISGIIEGLGKIIMENAKKTNSDQQDTDISGLMPMEDSMDSVNNLPEDRPRIIKTHIPVELMPEEALLKHKIIYVSRNPRDVVLSWYNHWRILEGYSGDFAGFFDAFLEDVGGYYSPFFKHNIGYWNIRDRQNVIFIFYEDMKKDLKSVINKVSKFLGKDLSWEQVDTLFDHLQFDKMKDNAAVNKQNEIEELKKLTGLKAVGDGNFMNKGKSGGWRSKLTKDQISRMEAWEEKRLQGTDLKFQYE